MARAAIVGSATWGTTLGIVLARNNVDVLLLCRSEAEAAEMLAKRENARFLPGVGFPDTLTPTASKESLVDADLIIFAVPSGTLRRNVREVRDLLKESTIVVSAAKGLELESGKRMSQVLQEELPLGLGNGVCVLSGPNLAKEIAGGKPSSTVIASMDQRAAQTAQGIVNSPVFRVYTNDDLIGVELAGALKNIIALGAGICDGMELGDNAKAALITRGLAEMTRLGTTAGANPLTFAGLAGMGDLIVTCSSYLSRNHRVGVELAKGRPLKEIRSTMQNVAEGIDTTVAALDMAKKLGVDMPITLTTYKVLYKNLDTSQAIAELMERSPRPELEDFANNPL